MRLFGEEEADAMLASDPVSDAVSEVMDEVDGVCSWTVRPPSSHDGLRYLVLVKPFSARVATRIRRSVEGLGASVEVRAYASYDQTP